MQKRPLGRSGLSTAPLVFGGNVFGWTADKATSFALLDAFVDAGLDGVDTADAYSRWVPGHQGGESETVIGEWLAANPGKRAKITLMTKVCSDMGGPGRKGLSRKWILQAAEESLTRLKTDVIDLYQSHRPDPETPEEETLRAYEELIEAGKVRAIGCSNYDAAQLRHALKLNKDKNLPRYETLQPLYNLYDRASYEGPLRDLAIKEHVGVIPYFGLASGFLTGKYRSEADFGKSPRGGGMKKYLDAKGLKILAALDAVSSRNDAKPAEVALAWLIQRRGVTAPIASATSLEQMKSLVRSVSLKLSAEDVAALDAAGT